MWILLNESLSQFCSSTFWDTDLTWNSPHPDLTVCFEKTVLVWVPCALLWLSLPWEIYFLRQARTRAHKIPFTWYNVCKLAMIAIMGTTTLIEIVNTIFWSRGQMPPADIYSPMIKLITFGLFFNLTYANVLCGVPSSGVLFLFSLVLVFCEAPAFRTMSKSTFHSVDFQLSRSTYYLAVLAVFLLNCFPDVRGDRKSKGNDEHDMGPENESSVLSKAFFAWFDEMAWKGYRKLLNDDDLWDIDYSMKTNQISNKLESKSRFEKITSACANDSKWASLLGLLGRVFGLNLASGILLKLCHSVLIFAGPLILKLILAFMSNESEYLWHGYFYSALFLAVGILQTLLWNWYSNLMFCVGLKIRTGILALLYEKALRISNGSRKNYTIGEMINLMAVDAEHFADSAFHIPILLVAPIEICIALYLLWNKLGSSILAGSIAWITLIPIQYAITSKYLKCEDQHINYQDKRIKLMNEMLSGIKVLKFNAWEPYFEKRIRNIREKEILLSKKKSYLNSYSLLMWTVVPFLVTSITFTVYLWRDEKNTFDAELVFVSLTLFNTLRAPMSLIPWCSAFLAATSVAIKRIDRFLNAEELEPDAVSHEARCKSCKATEVLIAHWMCICWTGCEVVLTLLEEESHFFVEPIVIKDGKFSWESKEGLPALTNINLEVKPGTLVAVVGLVGSGKSSLISAILGEIYKQQGFVNTTGTLAYVPQEAWIRNDTFKRNITFGVSTNHLVYAEVLRACALTSDLETLSNGDSTKIGEKGLNLSGGQKQRVSLARAVYLNADTYFLDDPLSAVDSRVGKHIFEQVIGPNGLLKEKTRIWVTHNLTYLSEADLIVVLQDGVISEFGTWDELVAKNGDFKRILTVYSKEESCYSDCKENESRTYECIGRKTDNLGETLRSRGRNKATYCTEKTDEREGLKQIESEKIVTSNITWRTYAYYLKAIGPSLIILAIVMNVIYQVFFVVSNYWLTLWFENSTVAVVKSIYVEMKFLYLGFYALFGFAGALCFFIHAIIVFLSMSNAAAYAHSNLLTSMLHWTATTFDTIPLGKIINRFGSDVNTLECQLPHNLSLALFNLATVTSTLFIVSYTSPSFLFVMPVLGTIYWIFQRFYSATSRQLKRLSSASKSPIYSHLAESVSGAHLIRAQNLNFLFKNELEEKIDSNLRSCYANIVAERWVAIRLELIGSTIVFLASFFAVLGKGTISTELVGWSITFALQITTALYWWTQKISETEMNFVAVERIKEYDDIEKEAAWKLPDEKVPEGWPREGVIVFEDFEARYQKTSSPALREISLSIQDGERVGIVGRTGAGKSSLALSLFRMIEPANGRILIDGIDITKIGLHTLRDRLTIIPQDPILFTGTLRFNLDPIDAYLEDENIWRALEQANLKNFVSTLDKGLYSNVAEGGCNFSVGQRQLICLARAVLRKTKILILDEATAALDMETDNLIQKSIREAFKDCTVLTIAHRLNSVLDYDRIIVLDKGSVVEFDSPNILLESEQSLFHRMALDAQLIK